MKNNKVGALGAIAAVSALMATSASAAIDPAGFAAEVTKAVGGSETVLTAGLAIVGGFFIWKILKKALNRAA